MNIRSLSTLLLVTAATGVCACSGDKEQPSSGAPAAAGTTSGVAGASSGAAGAGSAAAKSTGKTVHLKRTQGECTFDVDLPEEMPEATKDGMSFTLESASFSFVGFEGTTLHSKPEHALDMFKSKGEYKDVYRGTENGVQVTVVVPVAYTKPADKHDVSGMGGEPYASERALGCTFLCSGVRDREADTVAMCKSVRITVKPGANP